MRCHFFFTFDPQRSHMRGLYGGSLSLSHLAFGLSATPFSARRRYGQRAPIGVDKRGIVKEMYVELVEKF